MSEKLDYLRRRNEGLHLRKAYVEENSFYLGVDISDKLLTFEETDIVNKKIENSKIQWHYYDLKNNGELEELSSKPTIAIRRKNEIVNYLFLSLPIKRVDIILFLFESIKAKYGHENILILSCNYSICGMIKLNLGDISNDMITKLIPDGWDFRCIKKDFSVLIELSLNHYHLDLVRDEEYVNSYDFTVYGEWSQDVFDMFWEKCKDNSIL